jgi:hypothetical protein
MSHFERVFLPARSLDERVRLLSLSELHLCAAGSLSLPLLVVLPEGQDAFHLAGDDEAG